MSTLRLRPYCSIVWCISYRVTRTVYRIRRFRNLFCKWFSTSFYLKYFHSSCSTEWCIAWNVEETGVSGEGHRPSARNPTILLTLSLEVAKWCPKRDLNGVIRIRTLQTSATVLLFQPNPHDLPKNTYIHARGNHYWSWMGHLCKSQRLCSFFLCTTCMLSQNGCARDL